MKLLSSLFLLSLSLSLIAQNKVSHVKMVPTVNADIEKVARDYYDHFANIKGEKISETENIIEYSSKINPQGALESTIMQIKSLDNSYSWQALMLDTEDYKDAVAKYKELYKQLNGSKISLGNGKAYRLKGDYDSPDGSRAFASSIIGLDAGENEMHQFKIEIALNYAMPEWSVKIYVYEKEDDQDIRPTVNNDY
ncbi:MAG: hypothetical protein ABJA90_06975 [Ginsengibacter sp.]